MTLVSIQSDRYPTKELILAFEKTLRARKAKGWTDDPPEITAATVNLKDLADGNYHIHWFDPQTGRILICRSPSSKQKTLDLIPAISI